MKTMNSFLIAGMLLIAGSNVVAMDQKTANSIAAGAVAAGAGRFISYTAMHQGEMGKNASLALGGIPATLILYTFANKEGKSFDVSTALVSLMISFGASLWAVPVKTAEEVKAEKRAIAEAQVGGFRLVQKVY